MLQVGKFNKLKVVKTVDFGVYLDGGEKGEILLPRKFVPEQSCSEGGEIDVFVYYDSEDRLIATTQKPYAQVGEFAWLQVKSVNRIGAFLDWGVEAKDLLVPFREQNTDMQQGEFYIVYVYLDFATGEIWAVDHFLSLIYSVIASFKVVNTSLFVPCIWSLFTSTRQFNSCAADRKGRRRSKKYKTFLFISSLLSKTLKWRSFYRLRFNDPPTHNGR